MHEFFKMEFGQFLKKNSVKTNYRYNNQPIYQVINNIEHTGIKKGDYFYLDNLHFDHIEVFKENKVVRSVLNLDGTVNTKKTMTAFDQVRRIRL